MKKVRYLVSACLAGCNCRFDGTFTKTLTTGDGFLAKMLKERNIKVTEVD